MVSVPPRGRLAAFLTALLLTATFAGCVGDAPERLPPPGEGVAPLDAEPGASDPDAADPSPSAPAPQAPAPVPVTMPPAGTRATPQVVIAVIDSGINPYHTEFRDDSPLAFAHPASYIPGYPADAQPLPLTLNAPNLDAALTADQDTWAGADPEALYFVPGTRIIGLRSFALDGSRRNFDDDGHGTMTASRAAGVSTSLAPTARIIALEGLTDSAVAWAAAQPWIDVQSNSWVNLIPSPFTRATFEEAARHQPVFAASGNGAGQTAGAVGQPAFAGPTQGAAGVVAVGGHDNGFVTPWTGTLPHVAADACWSWAADAASMTATSPRVGSGTSAATPYVAGAAAALILEARTLLGDTGVHHSGGVLATGPAGVAAKGPLADGEFTLDELFTVLFKTADPRAGATPHDGDACDVTTAPYNTVPVALAELPPGASSYYFVGYGVINSDSLAAARDVLHGVADVPDRTAEDDAFAADATVRRILA